MQFAPLLFFFASLRIVAGADWCFQSQVSCNNTCKGPEEWGEVSTLCDGRAQSPVNIVTRKVLLDRRLTAFKLVNYQETFDSSVINNGHYVQVNVPDTIKISKGNLPTTYKALQLHFHWGKDGGPGSEHTIDGEQFPLEMHIVHIKEQYSNLSQAIKDHAGVAVLGFLFEESVSENKDFEPLINALKHIPKPTNSTTLTGVSLEKFTPPEKNMTAYFRYDGSLTTPDCAEAVVWSVFKHPIPLSREQLSAFSQLQFPEGKPMVKTFRPVQPLNGRQVYYSGAHVTLISSMALIMSVLVSSAL